MDAGKRPDSVKVICYGQEKVWDNRSEARAFYLAAIKACEGSERERYMTIYAQLCEGRTVCTDEED